MLISKENAQEIEIDLSYLKDTFNQEIDYLRRHIEICSATTDSQREIIENELLEKINEDPDKESELQTLFENRIRTINCHFFHSAILLVYANLENFLNSICTIIQNQTESPLLIQNIRARTDILTFKSFFKITTNIGNLEDEFSVFDNYRLLRNSIVHKNSKVKNSRDYDALKRAFSEEIDFDDSQNAFFIENKEFPIRLLDKIKTFFLSICDVIESKKYISFRINNVS